MKVIGVTIGNGKFPPPMSYDGIHLGHSCTSITRAFSQKLRCFKLERKWCNIWRSMHGMGSYILCVDVGELASRVWRDVIAVSYVDRNFNREVEGKSALNFRDAAEGMYTMHAGMLIDDQIDVEFWKYGLLHEQNYLTNVCVLQTKQIQRWSEINIVPEDSVLWERIIVPAQFKYGKRNKDVYWCQQVRCERWKMSAVGRFLPTHLRCCFST